MTNRRKRRLRAPSNRTLDPKAPIPYRTATSSLNQSAHPTSVRDGFGSEPSIMPSPTTAKVAQALIALAVELAQERADH